MKTISILQPWASLVAIGAKEIETRSWATKYRGPLLIHASKNDSKDSRHTWSFEYWVKKCFMSQNIFALRDMPHGEIIASCNLADVVPITPEFVATLSEQEIAFGDYTPGRFAWILEDVKPLDEPIPAKGQLGIWNFELEAALIGVIKGEADTL